MQFCGNCQSALRQHVQLYNDSRRFNRVFMTANEFCTAPFFAMPIFVSGDQSLAASMPAMHVVSHKFWHAGMRQASALLHFVLNTHHLNKGGLNKGGTCRGPCLETECTGGVRRVCVCRCDFAGCILTSRVLRRRQTNNAGIAHDPEKWLPVFGQDYAQLKCPVKIRNTGEQNSPVFFKNIRRYAAAIFDA